MHWTFCLERGAPQRVNHASVAIEDKIYSFGGYCSEQDMPIFIDVFCFDTNALKWTKVHFEETRHCPLACYGHSVVAFQHLVFLFGGQNVHGASNTLYCFNTKTLSWTRLVTSGRIPKPTDGHSACVIGDTMYTFGGFEQDNDSYSQKLYSLNLNTLRWQEIQTLGPLPCKRDFHTASVIGNSMYIFGGRSSEDGEIEFYPQEIMVLNTTTMKWMVPACRGSVPCGRRSHSSVVYNGEIYIFGGYDGNREKHMNDVHKYNPVTSVWTEIKVLGNPPHPRRRHCSVLVGDIVYLFGGSSPEDLSGLYGSRLILREHADMHMLEFAPSLKTLSLLKIMEHQIDFECLPVSLQSEIKWITSLKLQPVYVYQKRNYSAFAP